MFAKFFPPKLKTVVIMRLVAAALLPAVAAAAYQRGWGALWQVLLAAGACIVAELICLRLRKVPLQTVADGSALIAGLIIGLSLPPLAPPHVAIAAAIFAMTLAKHCYGGLGCNPFNPAMAGYALAFVSFPNDFGGWSVAEVSPAADAISEPTPLAAGRIESQAASVTSELAWAFPIACAAGGLVLLILRAADWRLTVSFILGALVFSGGDWRQLFLGGFMLAAFFVITDPVTAAAERRGRWVYGFAAGALVSVLRVYGPHADAIAFAILLCNMAAPLADRMARWK